LLVGLRKKTTQPTFTKIGGRYYIGRGKTIRWWWWWWW